VRIRLGAAVAAVGAVLATAAFAPGASTTYLQLNVCGNVCNHGGVAVVGNLSRAIAADRPFAVTLNEVCENQYDRLRALSPSYRGRFDPTGPVCGNGTRYGNAVLVRASGVDFVGSWPLPDPSGGETRRLMCVGTRSVVVCVTHVSYEPADVGPQILTVADLVRGLGTARPVILGGDFNTDPNDLRLNLLSRKGDDPGSGGTFGQRRIDYVFASGDRTSGLRARVTDPVGGLSDHRALLATAVSPA
jgi:endonuclease/exonuclease/phosphatase (EEP) superfamily protein YafD